MGMLNRLSGFRFLFRGEYYMNERFNYFDEKVWLNRNVFRENQ